MSSFSCLSNFLNSVVIQYGDEIPYAFNYVSSESINNVYHLEVNESKLIFFITYGCVAYAEEHNPYTEPG